MVPDGTGWEQPAGSINGRAAATWLTHSVSNNDELLRAFRVEPADLEANRSGRLGPGQIERLRRNIWTNALVVLPIQLLLVAFVIVAEPSTTGIILAGGLFMLLTVAELSWARRIQRVIREGSVRCLRGKARLRRSVQSGTWLSVGGERNRLWAPARYVVPGGEYRVYIAPVARLVVAMEPESWD
jgi:hypothetical protein